MPIFGKTHTNTLEPCKTSKCGINGDDDGGVGVKLGAVWLVNRTIKSW